MTTVKKHKQHEAKGSQRVEEPETSPAQTMDRAAEDQQGRLRTLELELALVRSQQ